MVLPELLWRRYNLTSSVTPALAVAMAVPSIALTSITRVGALATAISTSPHYLVDQQEVAISGSTVVAYNKFAARITVVDATTFTYAVKAEVGDSAAAGTLISKWNAIAQNVFLIADKNNTDIITIGPDLNGDFQEINPGQFTQLPIAPGARFDLGRWYFKSASSSQALRVALS